MNQWRRPEELQTMNVIDNHSMTTLIEKKNRQIGRRRDRIEQSRIQQNRIEQNRMEVEWEQNRQIDRQTDRDRQIYRQIDRHRDIETDIDTDIMTKDEMR